MSLSFDIYARLHDLSLGVLPAIPLLVLYLCVCRLVAALAHSSAEFSARPVKAHRGRQLAVVPSQEPTPHGPRPRRYHGHDHYQFGWVDAILCCVLQILDKVVAPAVEKATSSMVVFSVIVGQVKQAFVVPDLEAYVTPLKTRVQRGIAQVTALPEAFTPHHIQYRYLCPTAFLLVLSVALVLLAGVSIELAGVMCAGGCVAVVAGDSMGTEEEGENKDHLARQGADTRLMSALLQRT
jgi:hypothetical protein